MLRITIQETETAVAMKLEGRIVGAWVDELSRTWAQIAPSLGERTISIDLCNITYSDARGDQALRNIYQQSHATLIANNPWAKYIADEVTKSSK